MVEREEEGMLSDEQLAQRVIVGHRTPAGTDVLVTGPTFDRRLRHVVRHSPTGLEWGYGGSGPSDLARSILLEVLGDVGRCETCGGTNRLVYDERVKDFRAMRPSDRKPFERCFDCDDGYRHLPYQDFKFDVVARLDRDGFTLTFLQVTDWLRANAPDLVPAVH